MSNEQQANGSKTWSTEQQDVLDCIDSHVQHRIRTLEGTVAPQPHFVFINGRSGSGKSEILKHVAAKYRGQNLVVLCMAPTGLVALKFPGGTTAHNAFGLPVNDEDDIASEKITSNVSPSSQQADLLRAAHILVWDELPNQNSNVVEAAHELMCQLNEMPTTLPLGGVVVVGAGDFRQIPPVVRSWLPKDVYNASIGSMPLFTHSALTLVLTESQRDKNDPEYAKWVLSLGDGAAQCFRLKTQAIMHDGTTNDLGTAKESNMVEIPNMVKSAQTEENAIHFAFPKIGVELMGRKLSGEERLNMASNIASAAIISSTNKRVDELNKLCVEKVPGPITTLLSKNEMGIDNKKSIYFYDEFYLQGLDIRQVPPHDLQIKVGAIVMVLRNISMPEQCMNGSKAIIASVPNNYLINLIMLPSGERVVLRRIRFYYKLKGVKFSRTQFPLRLAYSLSINKSQGQTLSKVVVDMVAQPFNHGGSYVAFGRAENRHNVRYLPSINYMTSCGVQMVRNITWPQLLHHARVHIKAQPIRLQPCLDGMKSNAKCGAQQQSMPKTNASFQSTDGNQLKHQCHMPQNNKQTAQCDYKHHITETQCHEDIERLAVENHHTHIIMGPNTTYNLPWMANTRRSPHWCWGDGHCFYYAVAIVQGTLLLEQVQQLHSMLHGTPTCLATKDFLKNANIEQSEASLEEQQLMLQMCQCQTCTALMQHNAVAKSLRNATLVQLQQHQGWMMQVNGNNSQSEQEMQCALASAVNMQRFQHASWATMLEIRALAMALNQDIFVIENYDNGRGVPCVCYPAEPWTATDPRAQWYRLYEVCDQPDIVSIVNDPQNLCIWYNGTNHFEPLIVACS